MQVLLLWKDWVRLIFMTTIESWKSIYMPDSIPFYQSFLSNYIIDVIAKLFISSL